MVDQVRRTALSAQTLSDLRILRPRSAQDRETDCEGKGCGEEAQPESESHRHGIARCRAFRAGWAFCGDGWNGCRQIQWWAFKRKKKMGAIPPSLSVLAKNGAYVSAIDEPD